MFAFGDRIKCTFLRLGTSLGVLSLHKHIYTSKDTVRDDAVVVCRLVTACLFDFASVRVCACANMFVCQGRSVLRVSVVVRRGQGRYKCMLACKCQAALILPASITVGRGQGW